MLPDCELQIPEKIILSIRHKLKPNKDQKIWLDRNFNANRYAYNKTINGIKKLHDAGLELNKEEKKRIRKKVQKEYIVQKFAEGNPESYF